jgi:hypothetical protein
MIMKSDSHESIVAEKKERLADRLKRIEDDIAMLKEKVGIRD